MSFELKIGCDPELFLKKRDLQDAENPALNYVSAHNLIPGTKQEPYKVPYGAVQVDGTACEFNIDPASTEDEFVHNIQCVMASLKAMLPPDVTFSKDVTAYYSPTPWLALPKKAREIGCDPDFNAVSLRTNSHRPVEGVRSAGGHIHIGWTSDQKPEDAGHFFSCAQLVRQLDYFIGAPVSMLYATKDAKRWYSGYGRASCFRPKPYGVEYRTPANAWIWEEASIRWVFRQAKRAFEELVYGGRDYYEMHGNIGAELIGSLGSSALGRNLDDFFADTGYGGILAINQPELFDGFPFELVKGYFNCFTSTGKLRKSSYISKPLLDLLEKAA